jgi:uncharacterized protein YndB with AHSA1/START domain
VNDNPAIVHETLVLERNLSAPPSRVFAAVADPRVRATWTVPSDDEVLIYSATDFRPGGVDRFTCGLRTDPIHDGEVHYLEIAPDERVIYSERLSTEGSLVAISLITWELRQSGGGTRLTITDQMASLAGRGPVEGSIAGYTAALANLGTHLQTTGVAP